MKQVFDLYLALGGVIFLLPVWGVIGAAIRLTSKGPVIFAQRRVGKDGRTFMMYKFRTMVENAEELKKGLMNKNEADGPVFKIRDDPRYTRFGKWLAGTGLDESIQLVNVLRGEMSLVGPRPLPVEEAKRLSKIDKTRERVLPGMTSLWLVSGAHGLSFKKWMELDRYYVSRGNMMMDMQILARTLVMILRSVGGV